MRLALASCAALPLRKPHTCAACDIPVAIAVMPPSAVGLREGMPSAAARTWRSSWPPVFDGWLRQALEAPVSTARAAFDRAVAVLPWWLPVEIGRVAQRVAALACRLRAPTSAVVFLPGDGLEVCEIHTELVAAEMIDLQRGGQRPVCAFIRRAMRAGRGPASRAFHIGTPVAVRLTAPGPFDAGRIHRDVIARDFGEAQWRGV